MGQTAGGKGGGKSRQGASQGVWRVAEGMLRRLVCGAAVGRHITALPSASLLYRLETDSALAADGPTRSGPARSSRASHPRWLQGGAFPVARPGRTGSSTQAFPLATGSGPPAAKHRRWRRERR